MSTAADLKALAAPALPALIPHLTGRFVDAEATAEALSAFATVPEATLDDEAARFVLEDIALDEDIPEDAQLAAFALHLADCLSGQTPSEIAALLWPVWSAHIAALPDRDRAVWDNAAAEMPEGT